MTKLASPFLYALCIAPVFMATLAAIYFLERNIGLSDGLGRVGMMESFFIVGIFSILIFGLANRVINKLEVQLYLMDHFRQTALLYFIFFILALFLIDHRSDSNALDYALIAIFFMIAGFGIVINALCLLSLNRGGKSKDGSS